MIDHKAPEFITSDKWMNRFMSLAHEIATWSKDPRTQVGAVIVDSKKRVVGMGYNGFPRGVQDTPARYGNTDPTSPNSKYKYVVHAEVNAVLNAVRDLEGATLISTLMPCHECAKVICQSGIKWVYAHRFHSSGKDEVALEMFDEAGIGAWILP